MLKNDHGCMVWTDDYGGDPGIDISHKKTINYDDIVKQERNKSAVLKKTKGEQIYDKI